MAATALGDDSGAATWLLLHGASAQAKDHDGVTTLHLAAERGMAELAELLVSLAARGRRTLRAEPKRTNERGRAQTTGQYVLIASWLALQVTHGADPFAKDRDHATALMLCATSDENLELARALIAHAHELG
jgi:ankyrin repeat protein